ncbi:pfEMP1 [Plasmodium falciparum HB3]|uniref:PfEMP1 n=1 Tax=Plasmodium falciparum (isolate HB3) TaxID=137071 RepID=A0A0L7KMG8_PLAFX|nr:pfEMP1 [Plasmodium falciparum HB3]
MDRKGEAPKVVEPEVKKDDVNVCSIVDGILTGKKETDDIEKCKGKYKGGKYPGWNCNSQTDPNHTGACMPPRRQKLCVINLQYFTGETSDGLRKAFIECAAAETYLLWQKYKEDNNGGEDLQNQLKSGKIPEDFKRQMFYTFGDYRDFLFGTDISKLNTHTEAVKTNIDRIFPPTERTSETKRKEFWGTYGKDIWKGMLCALSYNTETKKMDPDVQNALTGPTSKYQYNNVKFSDKSTTLEKFAQTPQFLRWFTEWSDEFCRERKKKEEKVGSACKNDYDGCENTKDNGNGKCVTACKAYKEYISGKQTQYEKQAKKFDIDKSQNKPGYEDYSEKQASEYLKEKCINSSCDCILKVKKIHDYWTNPHKTYDTPSIGTKCQCPPPPCEIWIKHWATKPQSLTPKGVKQNIKHHVASGYVMTKVKVVMRTVMLYVYLQGDKDYI